VPIDRTVKAKGRVRTAELLRDGYQSQPTRDSGVEDANTCPESGKAWDRCRSDDLESDTSRRKIDEVKKTRSGSIIKWILGRHLIRYKLPGKNIKEFSQQEHSHRVKEPAVTSAFKTVFPPPSFALA
jgi:hypothetical protein